MPNMYDLLSQFQQAGSEFINNYCVINGAIFALDEIEKMGYDEFGLRAKFNMPMKLSISQMLQKRRKQRMEILLVLTILCKL